MSSRADALVVAALLSGGVLLNLAVQGPAIAPLEARVREHMQENQRALHRYTWKQRTELQLKGKVKNERVELVRSDEMQADTQEHLQRVMQRVVRYLDLAPASLSTPFEEAEVWEGTA